MDHTLIFGDNKIILNSIECEFSDTVKSLMTFNNSSTVTNNYIFDDIILTYNIFSDIFKFNLDIYKDHTNLILKIFDFFMIDKALLLPNKYITSRIRYDNPEYFSDTGDIVLLKSNINYEKEISIDLDMNCENTMYILTPNLFLVIKNNKYIMRDNLIAISYGDLSELEIKNTLNFGENKFNFDINISEDHLMGVNNLVVIKKANEIWCIDDNYIQIEVIKNANCTLIFDGMLLINQYTNYFVINKIEECRGGYIANYGDVVYSICEGNINIFRFSDMENSSAQYRFTTVTLNKYNTEYISLNNNDLIYNYRIYKNEKDIIADIEKNQNYKIFKNMNYCE